MFVWVASEIILSYYKILVLVLFSVGTIFIIFKFNSKYDLRSSEKFSLVSALCFVLIHQVIGFNLYPGLVKDISIFSAQHLFILGIELGMMFVFYNLCCACLLLKYQKKL